MSIKSASVTLLWGDDRGAIQNALVELRAKILRPDGTDTGMEAFNHERFDGPYTPSIAAVITACAQLPVVAPRRLVELSSPEAFGKHVSADDDPARAVDALVEYIAEPSPTTVLVITSTGLRSNSKLVKAASKSKAAIALRFEVPKDADAVSTALDLAKARGLSLDRRAAAALVDAVGGASSDIQSALERAAAYAGGEPIGVDHVQAVVKTTREANVFELTDAVGQGDHERALVILARLFSLGEKDFGTGQRVFSMLLRQIRMVFAARAATGDVGATLGVPPFIARKYEQQARRIDESQLRRAYRGLSRIDAEFKGGEPGSKLAYESPYLVLQRWILDVCGAMPGVEPRI